MLIARSSSSRVSAGRFDPTAYVREKERRMEERRSRRFVREYGQLFILIVDLHQLTRELPPFDRGTLV